MEDKPVEMIMRYSKYFFLLFFSLLFGCTQPEQSTELQLIGHRGATGLVPENTIPGFKKALDLQVNSIEFDVVISGDDQVVISHDPWFRSDICLTPDGDSLSKEAQMNHLIYEMDYEEIARYDCGSIQRPGFPDQETQSLAKPLMKEAIAEVESYRIEKGYPPIKYNVEIKSKPAWDNKLQPEPAKVARIVYDELQEMDMLNRIRIFAFDERILNEFQEIDSSVPLVYLISRSSPDLSENLSKLIATPDVYAPNYHLVNPPLIDEVHSRGMRIFTWTVNDYEEMVRLAEMGVDGIISDYPHYYKKLRENL